MPTRNPVNTGFFVFEIKVCIDKDFTLFAFKIHEFVFFINPVRT